MGTFYPEGTKPSEFIVEYAKQFNTVEMDSTWHHMPGAQLTESLNRRTPAGFIFSAKVPAEITHEKYLVDCDKEMTQFLDVMSRLGEKLGPMVLQFAYVAKGKDAKEYKTGDEFLGRLKGFLPKLSKDFRYVVEVRNSSWLTPELFDLLRQHAIALAITAYYTMPALQEMLQQNLDPVTTDFTFIRFIGHRKEIDALIQNKIRTGEKQREFDELIIDRAAEMRRWIPPIAQFLEKGIPAYIYFNNHYAGYAPGSARLFEKLWGEMVDGLLPKSRMPGEGTGPTT